MTKETPPAPAPAPPPPPAPAELLRARGLRVTATRLAVIRALGRRPHADADALIAEVRRDLGSVSPQTVYGVLDALVRAGIARRIEPAGSPALHELRVGDNHHHVVCRRCLATADIDCAVGRRPCLSPSETHGFLLDEAEVTFWGICPACQRAGPGKAEVARSRRTGAGGERRPRHEGRRPSGERTSGEGRRREHTDGQ